MKNKLFALICSGTCLLALFLTTEHFSFLPFSPIQISKYTFTSKERGLWVTSKAVSKEESKLVLQRDLVSKGYQPVQISIQNNTPKTYLIKTDNLAGIKVSSQTLANEVLKSAIPRSIGLKIASFFFWPLAIPSAIDGIHTMHTYSSLKKDYQAKELRNEQIPPYATINRILFVKSDNYKPPFHIKLIDYHSGEVLEYLAEMTT